MKKSIYETKFKTVYNNDFITWLYSNNRLLKLYDDKIIDFPLYKALSYIKGYRGYITDITIRGDKRYSDRELLKHLFSNVYLWYKRSNIRLNHDTKKNIYLYMSSITTMNRNNFSNGLKYINSRNYIPKQRHQEYVQALLG